MAQQLYHRRSSVPFVETTSMVSSPTINVPSTPTHVHCTHVHSTPIQSTPPTLALSIPSSSIVSRRTMSRLNIPSSPSLAISIPSPTNENGFGYFIPNFGSPITPIGSPFHFSPNYRQQPNYQLSPTNDRRAKIDGLPRKPILGRQIEHVHQTPPLTPSVETNSNKSSCIYLHRTAGDTERRYHLKYYKTGICIYDTDTRGYCVKNGPHCAFAHGIQDLRNPVYDVREMEANGSNGPLLNGGLNDGNVNGAPNSLDKERNALNEDPRWQDNVYVLVNYKTELCKRPPRLCRQGYACPQFHNSKDKRRTPKSFKYRSTPCPNVKQGDEWGDPINCEAGDNCQYCHTRTEQQFHPEIYKSTKCHDIQQTGYCPRGPFCAFAHGDSEYHDCTNVRRILMCELFLDDETLAKYDIFHESESSVVGRSVHGGTSSGQKVGGNVASSLPDHYTSIFASSTWSSGASRGSLGETAARERSASILTSSSNDRFASSIGAVGQRPRSYSTSIASSSHANHALSRLIEGRGMEKGSNVVGGGNNNSTGGDRRGSGIFESNSPIFSSLSTVVPSLGSGDSGDYGDAAGTVGSMVGSVLDDITIDDAMANIAIDAAVAATDPLRGDHAFDHHHQQHRLMNGGGGDTGSGIIPGSAPMNIPGRSLANSMVDNHSPPFGPSSHHLTAGSPGQGYLSTSASGPAYNPHNNSHASSFDPFGPFSHLGNTGGGAGHKNTSPSNSSNVVVQAAASILEINRLKDELSKAHKKIATYDEKIHQAINQWTNEVDGLKNQVSTLQVKLQMAGGSTGMMNGLTNCSLPNVDELKSLNVNQLQQLKQKLKNELDCIDQVCESKFINQSP